MTIRKQDDHDVLDWPAHGITMSRAQSEKLGEEGVELPEGEPHVYTADEAMQANLRAFPFTVLLRRMDFYHRGRREGADLESTE